jgi:hypothetical protein
MDKKQNTGYNFLFYGMAAGAVAAMVGSAYYLYNLFSQDEELSDADMVKIEQLKEEITEQIDEKNEQGLTPEIAVQIMSMTNRVGEEILKKTKPDLEIKRRAAINMPEEYERICQEYLEAKEYAYQEASKKVLTQFGDFNFEDINTVLMDIHPADYERMNHKYEQVTFDKSPKPERDTVKKAYLYYGKKFKEEMREMQKIMPMAGGNMDEGQQQYMFFKLLIMKFKVEDYLYLNFSYTEAQIKHLLFEYDLFQDPEIRSLNEQLARMDGMMPGFEGK